MTTRLKRVISARLKRVVWSVHGYLSPRSSRRGLRREKDLGWSGVLFGLKRSGENRGNNSNVPRIQIDEASSNRCLVISKQVEDGSIGTGGSIEVEGLGIW